MKTMEELRRELTTAEFRHRYGMREEPGPIRAAGEGFRFGDVERDLLGPHGIGHLAGQWQQRRKDQAVVPFVTGFAHRVLPELRPVHVDLALERSTHALGALEKERDTIGFINAANPPWAMAYLFHDCLERHGAVPTWDAFFAYVTGPAADKWWRPVKAAASRRRVGINRAERAMRWRLATAWQSAMRTTLAIATLRHEHEVPVRYHLFAHVELKIDAWHGDRAVRLVMPSVYEDRKTEPAEVFAGSGVEIHDIQVSRQRRGEVWLASPAELQRAAAFLTADEGAAGGQLQLFG